MKYSIRIKDSVELGYLSYRGKTSWCKRTAIKHAKETADLFMQTVRSLENKIGGLPKDIVLTIENELGEPCMRFCHDNDGQRIEIC